MSEMGVHSTEAWPQPASWKKTKDWRENENQAYFHESKGRKIKEKERLSHLSIYLVYIRPIYTIVFLSLSKKFSCSQLATLDLTKCTHAT